LVYNRCLLCWRTAFAFIWTANSDQSPTPTPINDDGSEISKLINNESREEGSHGNIDNEKGNEGLAEDEQDEPSEDIVIQDSNMNSGQALSKRRHVKKTGGVVTQQQKLIGSPTEPKLPLGTAPVTIVLSPQVERLRWWTERFLSF